MLRKAPPLPFLPASAHGTDVVIFPLVYAGDMEAGERAAAPVRRFGDPIGVALGPTPYAGFQTAFDPLLTPGGRNYWKSNNFSRLSDAAIDAVIARPRSCRAASARSSSPSSAARWRASQPTRPRSSAATRSYIMNVHGRWSDPADDERVRDWARRAFEDAAPHATGSGYVNFLTEDEGERVAASYGANHARLQALKQRFDPDNLFRMNLNIAPAAAPHRRARRHEPSRSSRLHRHRRHAGRARRLRARARRLPELARRRRGAAGARAAGGAGAS